MDWCSSTDIFIYKMFDADRKHLPKIDEKIKQL